MKKRMYLFIAIFVGAHSLYAQDCATGYCPATITVHHKAGDLSPIGADITYNVVKVGTLCWIAQNLGASTAPTAWSNAGGNYDGWVYQAGLKQGYVNSSPALVNISSWPSTWPAATDPCTLTFGSVWRLPTAAEWIASYNSTWSLSAQPNLASVNYYNSAGTMLFFSSGSAAAYYYSSDLGTNISPMRVQSSNATYAVFIQQYNNATNYISLALPVRCVKKVTD